jgi:hypothetical protein
MIDDLCGLHFNFSELQITSGALMKPNLITISLNPSDKKRKKWFVCLHVHNIWWHNNKQNAIFAEVECSTYLEKG